MSYFSDNYSHLTYPIETKDKPGLRNAQIGAIHAISSHFTVHDKEPAIIVMPTGSEKQAFYFFRLMYCARQEC
jgi:type I site-specific restriction endonuclease